MPCLNLHFLLSYSSSSFKIYGSFLFYFFFFYFVILKFLFAVLFFLKIFLTRLVSLFAYFCSAFHFPQVFGVFMKKRVSLKRDACVLWGGSGRKPLFTFALLTLLRGLWWRPPTGIGSPSYDLPTSWSTHLGRSHCDSACSDSGMRVPCLCRCVLTSMARFFFSQHARLLASSPVGL